MNNQVGLLLGSNFKNKNKYLSNAVEAISKKHLVVKTSSVYSSVAWGYESANDYVNQAIIINCTISAELLLQELLNIEKELGRTRSVLVDNNYEDRAIDIDIIFFSNFIINSPNLVVPHPRMKLRRFCLLPFNEIAPNFLVPKMNKTINQLLSTCKDKTKVKCL